MDALLEPKAETPPLDLNVPINIDPITPEPEPEPVAEPVAVEPEPAAEPKVNVPSAQDDALASLEALLDNKAPEAPVAEKPKPVEPPKAPEAPLKPSLSNRDYTGLNEDERKMFQNMSAQAYAKLRPIYDESKKLKEREAEIAKREEAAKNALPKGIFDNERAFILTEQYREASDAVAQLQFESDYWTQQLEKIEAGEDWQPLMQDAQGKYFSGQAQKADVKSKALVTRNIALAAQLSANAQGRVSELQANYTGRRAALVNGIKTFEQKMFPFFEGEHQHKAQLQELIQAIPDEFRDHPLAGGYAKAMLAVKILNANNQALARQRQVANAAASDVKKAGPSMSAVNNAPAAKTGKVEVTVDNVEEFLGLK